MSNKMWGGRFSASPSAIMEEINASIGFDYRLALQDIEGSKADDTGTIAGDMASREIMVG